MALSAGLSVDGFAASITDGMTFDKITFVRALIIAFTFAVFQTLMPVGGYFVSGYFYSYIQGAGRWIVLGVLCFLGGKLLIQGIAAFITKHTAKAVVAAAPDTLKEQLNEKMTVRLMLGQGLVTSIDAFLIGICLTVLQVDILRSVLFIGGITFLVCVPGVYIGRKTGDLLTDKVQMVGAIVLIGNGIWLFFKHPLIGLMSV
ncbi:MAG: manganese efflux pump [Treponema sp.]|nr:manganese efflux pump [Treponema sp.]